MDNYESYSSPNLIGACAIGFFLSVSLPSFEYQTYETNHLESYLIDEQTIESASEEKQSITYNLNFIKGVFNLNMSELANLLKVSRPTLYTWIKGEPTKNIEHQIHINFIKRYADVIASLNLERPDSFIKRPLVFNNQNIILFDLLKEQSDINSEIFSIMQQIDMSEASIRNQGVHLKDMQSDSDLFSVKYVSLLS